MTLTAADKAFRLRRVTASSIAQLIPGAYPDMVVFREKDALDLFVRATGRHVDSRDCEEHRRTKAGHRVERFVLDWTLGDMGIEWAYFGPVAHPEAPWFSATPDAVALERLPRGGVSRLVVEAKAVGIYLERLWGAERDGADGVPPYVYVQCEAQAEVCGADECLAVGYFGGTDRRVYRWEADRAFGRSLVEIATRYHVEHLLPDRPPAPGRWTSIATIAALYPEPLRPLEPASGDETLLVEEYFAARALEAEAKEQKEEIAAALAVRIADRDGVEGETWRARFRAQAPYRVEAFEVDARRVLDVRVKGKGAKGAKKGRAA